MANNVIFKDYCPEIANKLQHAAEAWLEEASGELETQAMRNTRVGKINGGRTKASWSHHVDNGALEATVGSSYQNAIWEEFGTGVYAENGGRNDVPWSYKDAAGQWHRTKGKRGTRAFRKAYTSTKPKLIKAARQKFKDALG